jgi:hypothetical protein
MLRAQWPTVTEAGLTLAALAIAFSKPDLGHRAFQRLEHPLGDLARKRGLAVIAVILFALASRAALFPVVPIPAPTVHDEFSYLLMADTFASGRLSNPTHPMWKHFESFHVNQQPVYGSKYPVAQGLILAIGQVLAGHPWFGVWLSAALMCGAICWMLQGWLPPGWALLGGLLAVLRFGLFSYWTNSYWGGAVAAIGGSLVLGALGRMQRKLQIRDALWMAIGASVLANSRPYEGMVLCVGVAAVLLFQVARGGAAAWRCFFVRIALPVSIVFAITAVCMGIYFQANTGNPFLSPYQAYERQYSLLPTPGLVWRPLKPTPVYRHPMMRKFYVEWEAARVLTAKSAVGFATLSGLKLKQVWLFFLGPALTLGLLMAHRTIGDRRVRPLLWIAVISAAGLAAESLFSDHYAAPMTSLLLALTLQGLRHLRCCRFGRKRVGLFLVRTIPAIYLILVAVRVMVRLEPNDWPTSRSAQWCCTNVGNVVREQLIARLEGMGGLHLAIVRYQPDHDYHEEWVYNAADIDNAKVLFAREMDPVSDRELREYFKDRQAWLVEPDEPRVRVSPIASASGPNVLLPQPATPR